MCVHGETRVYIDVAWPATKNAKDSEVPEAAIQHQIDF